MILHTKDGDKSVSVASAKGGVRYAAITLSARDFRALSALSPEKLSMWVGYWHCGFPPDGLGNDPVETVVTADSVA